MQLLGGEKQFVLGASGHIAGVVNPPAGNKRSFWTSNAYPEDTDAWLGQASEQRGSWWPTWSQWLRQHSGGKRIAPAKTGNARHKAIEPAPGRYVKEKAK